MSEELHEMVAFVLGEEDGITPARARSVASCFSIEEFL
jgi:hypothetical protein